MDAQTRYCLQTSPHNHVYYTLPPDGFQRIMPLRYLQLHFILDSNHITAGIANS